MLKQTAKTMLGAVAAITTVAAIGVMPGNRFIVEDAQAVIGRPLTPASYAGVARRTTRRVIRRTSVYAATLPRGCTTVIVSGTSLYSCGPTYYQAAGGRYVVVNID